MKKRTEYGAGQGSNIPYKVRKEIIKNDQTIR